MDMDTNVADPEIITTNLPRKPAKIRILFVPYANNISTVTRNDIDIIELALN